MQDLRNAHRVAVIALILGLVACATSKAPITPAWNRYVAFETALRQVPNVDFEPYLSAKLLPLVQTAPGIEEREQYHGEASYPLWLDTENAHYEKTTTGGAICLTVNGLSRDGKPASTAVRFVEEDNKADEIIYGLVESVAQLPTSAQCPSNFMASETDI